MAKRHGLVISGSGIVADTNVTRIRLQHGNRNFPGGDPRRRPNENRRNIVETVDVDVRSEYVI